MTISDMFVKTSKDDRLARAHCLGDGNCGAGLSDPNFEYPCVGVHCSSIRITSALSFLQANGRLQRHGFASDVQYSGVGEKSGVRLFHAEGSITWGSPGFGLFNHGDDTRDFTDTAETGRTYDYETYGAWLDHSAFWVVHDSTRSGSVRSSVAGDTITVDNLAGWQMAYGASVGNETGTRPTGGSAIWRGVMVGITRTNGPLQAIRGDASLTYDTRQNHLDVAFTNVRNLDAGASFRDMRWSDLPVGSDGSFRVRTYNAATQDTQITGRFYGPGHAEVGGNFHHYGANAIGAYGAKRQ